MTESVSSKLYLAAKKVNDLNSSGKVKGFSGNEKGYAKILEIMTGCAIWIHHLKNEHLIIDLLVTEAATRRFPEVTNKAIKKFEEIAGDKLRLDVFEHAISKSDKRDKLYIDVTNHSFEKIEMLIDKLLRTFDDFK